MNSLFNSSSRVPLAVAIITKDEAANLPCCLQSVAFAAQIVVVDSGSTDNTLQIARDFGCDVYEEPWRGGFGAQKQFAIDKCRQPWILVLDADERIPAETMAAITEIVVAGETQDRGGTSATDGSGLPAGYSFPRKNFFQGRWIRHAGWWPDRLTRLFRRGYGRMSPAAVHEGVEVNGFVAALDCPIEHYTESDLGRILAKIDRYSTLGAREARDAGKQATVAGALSRAVLTFFHGYVLRRGFLDGAPGLTLAVTDAVNKFFKYAKLSELGRRGGYGGQ